MNTRRLSSVLVALLIVVNSGCDSSESGDGEPSLRPGTYTAKVTGLTETTMSGSAFFTGATTSWGLALGVGSTETITFLSTTKERPGVGTYEIRRASQADGPIREGQFSASLVLSGGSYSAFEGTLMVTRSEVNRLEGSFSFKADQRVGQVLEVQGSFNASNPSGM